MVHTEDTRHRSGPNIELNIEGSGSSEGTLLFFPKTCHIIKIRKPILILIASFWFERSTYLSAFLESYRFSLPDE